MFTVAGTEGGELESSCAAALAIFLRGATLYYSLCILFGALAFLPKAVSSRLPKYVQVLRNVLLNSVGRGKTYDEEGARRLGRGVSALIGRLLSASVPKKWFSHLYHVACVWNLALLALVVLSSSCLQEPTSVTKLLAQLSHRNTFVSLLCIQFHVTRRLLENYYVHSHSEEGKMQLVGYVFGLLYYVFLPANFFAPVLDVTGDRVYQYTVSLRFLSRKTCEMSTTFLALFAKTMKRRDLVWIAVFFFGNLVQYQTHVMLASLRKTRRAKEEEEEEEEPSQGRYKIPRGIWFKYCSNPHYLAEVILYIGFITLSNNWHRGTALLMTMVVMNLLLSATMTHDYYKRVFKDAYPSQRYAMFPGII